MIPCSVCGLQNENGVSFCANCGSPLGPAQPRGFSSGYPRNTASDDDDAPDWFRNFRDQQMNPQAGQMGQYGQPMHPSQQQGYPPVQPMSAMGGNDNQMWVPPGQWNQPPPQQNGAYPPQQNGAYPPQQNGAYPPQQNGAYPPQQNGAYPPQQNGDQVWNQPPQPEQYGNFSRSSLFSSTPDWLHQGEQQMMAEYQQPQMNVPPTPYGQPQPPYDPNAGWGNFQQPPMNQPSAWQQQANQPTPSPWEQQQNGFSPSPWGEQQMESYDQPAWGGTPQPLPPSPQNMRARDFIDDTALPEWLRSYPDSQQPQAGGNAPPPQQWGMPQATPNTNWGTQQPSAWNMPASQENNGWGNPPQQNSAGNAGWNTPQAPAGWSMPPQPPVDIPANFNAAQLIDESALPPWLRNNDLGLPQQPPQMPANGWNMPQNGASPAWQSGQYGDPSVMETSRMPNSSIPPSNAPPEGEQRFSASDLIDPRFMAQFQDQSAQNPAWNQPPAAQQFGWGIPQQPASAWSNPAAMPPQQQYPQQGYPQPGDSQGYGQDNYAAGGYPPQPGYGSAMPPQPGATPPYSQQYDQQYVQQYDPSYGQGGYPPVDPYAGQQYPPQMGYDPNGYPVQQPGYGGAYDPYAQQQYGAPQSGSEYYPQQGYDPNGQMRQYPYPQQGYSPENMPFGEYEGDPRMQNPQDGRDRRWYGTGRPPQNS